MRKRWTLHALPVTRGEFDRALAEHWNAVPDRYWTRRGAMRAAQFYESRMYLPLQFIVKEVDRGGRA